MPSLLVLIALSAPTILIGSWMTIMAIHLTFQHANLDYRLGFFKYLLAVAEVHRWHHKRGYINKNFGEVFIFWDILFKTYYFENHKIDSNTVGLNKNLPNQYIKQLLWPFKK